MYVAVGTDTDMDVDIDRDTDTDRGRYIHKGRDRGIDAISTQSHLWAPIV